MRRVAALTRRFRRSTRATAAIEFALIIPALLILFLGSLDAGRAVTIYMKLRAATYAVDEITNQYTTIHDPDMQQILAATSVIFSPYSSTPAVVVISQLTLDANGKATVSWSNTLNGTARTVGSTVTIPAALATPNSYLILGEVSYTYSPLFNYFTKSGFTLSDNMYVTPRSSASITRTSP